MSATATIRCGENAMDHARFRGVAVLGNHLPRRCGIATFTTHLTDGLAAVLPDAAPVD
jgi:hypothetical protein